MLAVRRGAQSTNLAPFIGFPRTLNAVATINEVFADRGIALPLPAQGSMFGR